MTQEQRQQIIEVENVLIHLKQDLEEVNDKKRTIKKLDDAIDILDIIIKFL